MNLEKPNAQLGEKLDDLRRELLREATGPMRQNRTNPF